jgi:D-psicose/D-tagatose/L-ribulose 3-epimerase
MPVGFNMLLWATHVTAAHLPVLQALKDAGYDGVEVPVFEGDPGHFADLARVLDDLGLRRTAVGVVPDAARNPMSLDPVEQRAGINHLKWLVDCSHALGAEVICGPFTQPLGVFSGQGATAAEWAALVRAHQAMADHAGADHAGVGLTVAVEPLNRFECYALNTATQAAQLVADVGRANYGYLYDTFHANIEERDPVGVIATTAAAIKHVHLSENDRGTPGRGHVDLAATLAALKAVHYDRWLTVEAFGQSLPDLAAATRVWRPLFGTEAEVYTEARALIRRHWH